MSFTGCDGRTVKEPGPSPLPKPAGEAHGGLLSRRTFLGQAAVLAVAAALTQLPGVLRDRGWLGSAHAAPPDVVHETLSGLVAFIVPGPDAYSVAQGVTTEEPGGMDANILEALIATLDDAQPHVADLPPLSMTAAAVLNGVAQAVDPSPAGGPFSSPFANLAFPQKVAVFAYLDADPVLAPLAGLLALAVAFLAYSEAGVFDPQTRKLTGRPIGWAISEYEDEGVGRGTGEFKGYFQDRRKAD